MKTISLIAICGLFFCYLGLIDSPGKNKKFITTNKISTDTSRFILQVHPILQKNCSPCHFPGGKMYAKLPFDEDSTIINHEAGILKRIKGEEENTIIRTFIQQNKKPG